MLPSSAAAPIGAACARELALDGRRVVVVEQGGDRGQAWKAAAGMLAPQIEAGPDDPAMELGLAGRELYSSLAESLRETTGLDIGLWREGIAWVAADESEAADLRSRVAWQRQQSQLSDWLDAEEVKSRWPWLGSDRRRTLGAARGRGRSRGAGAGAPGRRRAGGRSSGRGHRGRWSIEATALWAGRPEGPVRGGRRRDGGRRMVGAIEGVPRPIAVAPVRGQMAAFPWPDGARPRSCTVTGATCSLAETRPSSARPWSTSAFIPRSVPRDSKSSSPAPRCSAPHSIEPAYAVPGPASAR